MPGYRERLTVPLSWWLVGGLCVVILTIELMAGWPALIAGAIIAVMGGGFVAVLLAMGRARVTVTPTALTVGRESLPLLAIGEVRPLDAEQTRAMKGPRANPAALVLSRPYLGKAVYVELPDWRDGPPYWLVGTRRPEALADAIRAARPASAPGHANVG